MCESSDPVCETVGTGKLSSLRRSGGVCDASGLCQGENLAELPDATAALQRISGTAAFPWIGIFYGTTKSTRCRFPYVHFIAVVRYELVKLMTFKQL